MVAPCGLIPYEGIYFAGASLLTTGSSLPKSNWFAAMLVG